MDREELEHIVSDKTVYQLFKDIYYFCELDFYEDEWKELGEDEEISMIEFKKYDLDEYNSVTDLIMNLVNDRGYRI